jgi:hypothetical protein
MNGHGRGTCPICHREYNLTKNGHIRHHPMLRRNSRQIVVSCDGSGQPPQETQR